MVTQRSMAVNPAFVFVNKHPDNTYIAVKGNKMDSGELEYRCHKAYIYACVFYISI